MTTNIIANPLATGTDELERLAFEEIVKRRRFGNTVRSLVIPAGNGDLAVAMAKLDCKVTAADEPDLERAINGRALAAGLKDNISFFPSALQQVPEVVTDQPFDLIVCRRGLCAVPYDEARTLVHRLLLQLKIGGKLYISLLGLNSELGDDYPGRDELLADRFGPLSPRMAEKYDIHRPVCLYSERNLFSLLLESGASVLRTFTSTHGNVKGVAVRV